MNQLQRIIKAVKQARSEFLRQTERHIKTVIANYEQAQQDIEQQLLKRIDKPIDSYPIERLRELDSHIKRRIDQIAYNRNAQILNALESAQKSGFDAQMLQREIMGKPTIGIDWTFFVPRGVEYYQSFALQLCDQYDAELVTAIQQQLRMGFIERKSWNSIITDIRRNAFGFKKYQRVDRKDKGATWKIKRMVRTEMQRMRTMAEEEVINSDKDIIGVSFHFGGGPCDGSCQRLVGDYYKDGKEMGWPPPTIPIHPNCMCYTTNIYPEIRDYIQKLPKQERIAIEQPKSEQPKIDIMSRIGNIKNVWRKRFANPESFEAKMLKNANPGKSLNEIESAYVKAFQEEIDKSHIMIRIDHSILDKIVKEGRLKTQFETKTSKGILDTERRAQVEFNLFGIKSNASPSERPIYGFMREESYGNYAVKQYGNIVFVLKDEVKDRATITMGDSLGETFVPTPAKKIQKEFLNYDHIAQLKGIRDIKGVVDDTSKIISHYIEAQVHGGVEIARDVEEVVITKIPVGTTDPVTKKYKTEWVYPELPESVKTKLTEWGIKISHK